MEKPLHVKVADAMGWTQIHPAKGGEHEGQWIGLVADGSEWAEVPRYDTDWSATGPLIERYGIGLQAPESFAAPHLTGCRWGAYDVRTDVPPQYETPLVAVCNLILSLHSAGKLDLLA